MPRVRGNVQTRARRKKILKLAKGYFGAKHTLYKTAHETVMKALSYGYRDRKQTKRNMRKLWITRINAACRLNGFKYSSLINGLLKAGVQVNRKMLADLALNDPKGFTAVVEVARKGLAGDIKPQAVEAKPVVKAAKVEKAVEPKVEAVVETQVELETLTVAQLKEVAQGLGLTGLSGLKKAELVEAIKQAQK